MSTIKVNKITPYSGDTVAISGSSMTIAGNTTLGDSIGTDTVTVIGNMTASGDISASGTIYASSFESPGDTTISVNDSLDITGNITASGNISASGFIGTLTGTATGLAGSPTFTGNVTASNHISASGDIYANEGRFESSVWVGNGEIDDNSVPRLRLHTPPTPLASGLWGGLFVDWEGADLLFRYDNTAKVSFASASGDIYTSGSIEASGSITALGSITATGDISSVVTGSFGYISSSTNVYAADFFDNQTNINTIYSPIASPTFTGTGSFAALEVSDFISGSSIIMEGLPTIEAQAESGELFTLSGSQIFSSSAWTSGHIINNATSMSKFVFQKA